MSHFADSRRRAREKRPPGGFVALPHLVIRSDQFTRLSAHAIKLLVDLLAQYNGRNNGDLCTTWTTMRGRGWRSRDTLAKAQRELLSGGWIALTRQGGLHTPSLYGVTFFALDWSPKIETKGSDFPRGEWARIVPTDRVLTKRGRQHADRVNSLVTNTPIVSIATREAID